MLRSLTDITDAEAQTLYATGFEGARSLFDAACREYGLEMSDHPIGESGDSLRLAQCGPVSSAAKLIILSGLHGVEGHCGSAAQIAFIRRLAGDRPHVHVVLVHGINPGGMRALRRTNADNIDLNRNFLTDQDYAALARVSDRSRAIGRLFSNPVLSYLPDLPWLAYFAAYVATHGGMSAVKEVLAGGQFFDPKAVFYGGTARAPELRSLEAALRPILANARADRTILFDLHSGIGDYAQCSLLANGGTDLPLDDVFGRAVSDGHEGDQAVYPARGDVIRGLKTRFCLTRACGVTFECGTGPAAGTLMALRAANSAHMIRPGSPARQALARRRVQRAFCPDDPVWRGIYVRESSALMARAFSYLSSRVERHV
ncbi:MAG: hypothetical protein BM562_06995 [Alphaproteobacteria bacterium MedPE-SWcel]|nr:MAG: hypothetical protein BM562_06995 [Alphaproteobacteria bacterium MedPE-SWcel]